MGSRFIIDVLSGSGTGNHLGPGTLVVSSSLEIASGSQTSSSRFFSRQITGSIYSVDGTAPFLSIGTGITPAYDGRTGQWASNLNDTSVTPGSYTRATITVDAQGRITAASANSAGSGGGGAGESVGWEAGNNGVIVTSGSVGIGYKPLPPGGELNGQAVLHVSASNNSLPAFLISSDRNNPDYESQQPLLMVTTGSNKIDKGWEAFTIGYNGQVAIGAGITGQTTPDASLTVSASLPNDPAVRLPKSILQINGPGDHALEDVEYFLKIVSGSWPGDPGEPKAQIGLSL